MSRGRSPGTRKRSKRCAAPVAAADTATESLNRRLRRYASKQVFGCDFDRRGNTLYKRSPEGEEIARDVEQVETITVGGRKVARTLRRKERIPDNDLPEIAKRYRAFRREHPEPAA